MKKWKKPLSVLLAVVMAASSMTVAFSVLAAERPLGTVAEIKQAISDDYGLGANFPKLANDLKDAYAKLSVEDKDSLGAEAVSKIMRLAFNAQTGGNDVKVANAAKALGGYTPRQQKASDYATAFSDAGLVAVDGKDVVSRMTYYKFTTDYKTSGSNSITFTKDLQKAHFEKLVASFKEMIVLGDDYVYALANSFYPGVTGSGSAGIGYAFGNGSVTLSAVNNMLKVAIAYADAFSAGLAPAAKQQYVFDLLGLKDAPTSAFNVVGAMNEYSSKEYQDALKLYQTDAAANKDTFLATVKTAVDKAAVVGSLEQAVAANTVAIIAVTDDKGAASLKTVNSLWQPVADQYNAIPVIDELNALDISKVVTKDDVNAAVKNYKALSYGAQTLVGKNTTAITKYNAVVKIGNDLDTAKFRNMVTDYIIPSAVTDENKDEILAFVAQCEAEYKAISSLQSYVKTNYPAVITKYNQILELKSLISVTPFMDAVASFDLNGEKGSAMNETIKGIKAQYTALSSALKTYVKDKQVATYEKYNAIMKCWTTLPGEDLHIMPTENVVRSEDPLTQVIEDTLIPNLGTILNQLLAPLFNSTETDLNGKVTTLFTNETVTEVIKVIYPTIYNLLAGMPPVDIFGSKFPVQDLFSLRPAQLAPLFEGTSQLANAAAKLATYGNESSSIEIWNEVSDIDWGVIPGDYDTFMNAFLPGALRGLNGGLGGGFVVTTWTTGLLTDAYDVLPDGSGPDMATVVPSGYDSFIIPLLEALGATDIPSSIDYSWGVKNTNSNAFLDSMLRPIIDVLYGQVLVPFAQDPGTYLAKNLPNLVYHLDDGCILDNMMATLAINPIPMVGMNLADELKKLLNNDVSLDGIFNFLTKPSTAADGTVTPPLLDLAAIGLDLTVDDIKGIANLGAPKQVKSTKTTGTTVRVDGDVSSVSAYLSQMVGKVVSQLVPGLNLDFAVKGEFVKVEAPQYPHNGKMDKKVVGSMIDGLDALLGGLLKINDIINSALCTNEMAANAMTGIYTALAPTLSSIGIYVNPKDVAAMMHEDRYAELRIDLQHDSWSDVGLVIKNDKEVIYQANMGFKDGERDGFVNSIVAMLRPLVKALVDNGLIVNTDTTKGLYETLIIPMFEAIGLTPAVDSATYTENYRLMAQKTDKTAAYDYLVKTILSPVLGLLNDFAAAPAKTLMKLLPNLAYGIQYNPTLAFVGNLLDGKGGLASVLNGAIGGLIEGFTLPEIPLDALASCGTFVEKTSKNATQDKYTVVAADSADAFVTVYYYLYDAVNNGNNLQLLKDMVADIEMDDALKGVVNNVLNDIFTASKEDSLCKLGELLASDVWACPNADGNGGSKTPSTGDYAIPTAVFLTMMVGAGAVIVLMRKKRERVSN